MTDTVTTNATPVPITCGPRIDEGKRVSTRNATTHGLFARDVVLPHLGEDPAGYRALLDELAAQIRPKNLLDQHYTEKIAAASWRLRRLHRWQAQLFEDPDLTEDEALSKLDRVMRHETALHRQIDTAVRMLGKEVPGMFTARLRDEQLAFAQVTERDCQEDPEWDWVVASNTREQMRKLSPRPAALDHDPAALDTAPTARDCQNEPLALAPEETVGATRWVALTAPAALGTTECQNEPAPALPPLPLAGEVAVGAPLAAPGEPEGVHLAPAIEKCQNEPAHATLLSPPAAGGPYERGTSEQGGGSPRRTNVSFPLPGERFYPDAAEDAPPQDWRKARLRAQTDTARPNCQNELLPSVSASSLPRNGGGGEERAGGVPTPEGILQFPRAVC